MVIRTLTVAVASVLLAACTVGPDYVRPNLPAVDQFSNSVPSNSMPSDIGPPQTAQAATPSVDV